MTIAEQPVRIIQDAERAIAVMHSAGSWLQQSGKRPSRWWRPENLNADFLSAYAQSQEFYVLMVGEQAAAAAVLQAGQDAQNWNYIDQGQSPPALYVHWLCVRREFAGTGLPHLLIQFAARHARKAQMGSLRVDTDADEKALRQIYEALGFQLVAIRKEDYRSTAFYELPLP